MKIGSLQTRIIVFFGLLTVAVQVIGLILVDSVGTANARRLVDDQLMVGERMLGELLQKRVSMLAQASRVLAADYAFREALASHDNQTIVSALENHGARIDAQVMMLVDLDGRVVARTGSDTATAAWPALAIRKAAQDGRTTGASIVGLGDRLYQIVAMPVAAPLPVGWVVTGFAIDDAVANELRRVTSLDVTFLTRRAGSRWRAVASTLTETARAVVEARIGDDAASADGSMTIDGEAFAGRVSRQQTFGDEPVVALLQLSLEKALAPSHDLMRKLAEIALAGFLMTMLFGIAIARGIARPVRQLAGFARRIAAGHYDEAPQNQRTDEIGDLSNAFEQMRGRIESRERRILDLAYRDALTKLPNRALFHDRLQQAVALARRTDQPVSVLLLDIDRFAHVNDTLGHHVGDRLLQHLAERLDGVMRRETDTVARLGGDEFAVLLPGTDADGARIIARAILQAIDQPANLDQHLVDIDASIGIAAFPVHGDDEDGLLRRADIAMYEAKRTNTGVATYDVRHHTSSVARLSLMGELRRAVEENQLVVHYQPKVHLRAEGPPAVEALVRWQHPRRGFIAPVEFIPFAEQTGYIRTITLWVLEQVVVQCEAWRAEGLAIEVSINLSARDLINPDLPTRFGALMRAHGCSPASVCLEITESAILEDATHALENLDRLAALGCRIALDDYGTGYSSLSYLKSMPVDELKIDRSFVKNLLAQRDDDVIVQSTIDLAHKMALTVTAEGVEDQATLDRLRAMGCDRAQGYLMGRPIPADELTRWMRRSPWAPASLAEPLLMTGS